MPARKAQAPSPGRVQERHPPARRGAPEPRLGARLPGRSGRRRPDAAAAQRRRRAHPRGARHLLRALDRRRSDGRLPRAAGRRARPGAREHPIGRFPRATSALSPWAVLDLSSRGWRDVVMTPKTVAEVERLRHADGRSQTAEHEHDIAASDARQAERRPSVSPLRWDATRDAACAGSSNKRADRAPLGTSGGSLSPTCDTAQLRRSPR